MARSITYWYDIIIAEKNTMANLNALQPNVDDAQTLLTDVKSTSKVARWRLWIWCVAVMAFSLDVLFDFFKLELEDIATRSRFGTLPWYVDISKKYQHGYNLVWINNGFSYAVDDEPSKIIKRAAAVEVATVAISVVNLKVAKLTGNVPTPLSVAEKNAFTNYISQIKPAGVAVNIISAPADDLKLYLNVVFDPLVLTSHGESILNGGTFPVQDAVNNYISNLPFNGTLELCELIDEIQSVEGVMAAYVTSAEARYGANPYAPFTERYSSNAGHMIIDAAFPLDTTITYLPNV